VQGVGYAFLIFVDRECRKEYLMKNRISWFLALAGMGAYLCLYAQSAVAQQSKSGPDQGQQGEFTGENVDSGAAAVDAGPEAVEGPEVAEGAEATETAAVLSPVTAHTAVVPAALSIATNPKSAKATAVEGDFDLQEISGPDTAETN
jgi:hypothetical protein